ncbi:hypothetical protein GGI03_001703 [Coemansia sp. RSA 2337]|nr:hypothetical protein GGI03_001703 [Coemansia sp. RSA 2337]
MSAHSPLQLLPIHVVQLIVNHVAGSSRVAFDGVDANSPKYRMLLKPLLWVCHNFRAVAYSRYCNKFELNLTSMPLNALDELYLGFRCSSVDYRTISHLGYSTHRSAKEVTVFLDERAVYSGEALGMVSCVPYEACSLPLARKIAFIFVTEKRGVNDKNAGTDEDTETDEDIGTDEDAGVDEDIGIDPLIVMANICAFRERVKQMAPLVSEIRIQPTDRKSMPSIYNPHFSDLASRLYQLSYRIDYNYTSDTPDSVRLQLDPIFKLTHIRYTSDSSIGTAYQFIQLARVNALTLQSLVLESEHDIDILSLVQDADGNHIEYPRLLTLKLWSVSNSINLKRPVFQGTAPFPILRQLRVFLECPFDDDTFFRGNSATLEWLDMQLDSLNAPMLRKYKVFAPGSHPRLQRVKLWYNDDFGSELLASPTETIQFMYCIGSGAAVREHVQIGHLRNYVPMSLSLGNYECIQVLSLLGLRSDLWSVIALIKSLPLLSDLHTSMPSLGPMPDGVTPDTLPELIISNYAPMGRRFRCWHLNNGSIDNHTELITCVLLLALACPNFDYAAPPVSQRELFMKRMDKDIGSNRFKPYAPRLCRLLFHGWDGKKDSAE